MKKLMKELKIHDKWEFVYGVQSDPKYKDLLCQYKHGFYYDLVNKNAYSFEEGISHLVGKENEDRIYNMWWCENS